MEKSPVRTPVQVEAHHRTQGKKQLRLKRPSSVKKLRCEILVEMAAIDRSIRYIPNPQAKRQLSNKYLKVQHSLCKLEVVTSPQRKATRRSSFVGSAALEGQRTPSGSRRNRCDRCLLLLSTGVSTKYCPRHGLYPQ